VMDGKVGELKGGGGGELNHIGGLGGTVAAVESGYLKQQLVESNSRRVEAIERGEQTVVGVNRFTETEASPLAAAAGVVLRVTAEAEADQIVRVNAWRGRPGARAVVAGAAGVGQA